MLSKQDGEKLPLEKKLELAGKEMTKVGLKYQICLAEPHNFLETGFTGKNLTVKLRVFAVGDRGAFKIISDSIAKVPPEKTAAGYKLVNDLNREYKYAKFTLEDKGNVVAQWDLPDNVDAASVGPTAVEMLLRMANIIDNAYPRIMKTIWA